MPEKKSRNVVDDHDTTEVEENRDTTTHTGKDDGDSKPIDQDEYADNAKESKEDSDQPR
jgi:hypothetical protein